MQRVLPAGRGSAALRVGRSATAKPHGTGGPACVTRAACSACAGSVGAFIVCGPSAPRVAQ